MYEEAELKLTQKLQFSFSSFVSASGNDNISIVTLTVTIHF